MLTSGVVVHGAVPLKGCAWDIRGPALDSSQVHAAELRVLVLGAQLKKWRLRTSTIRWLFWLLSHKMLTSGLVVHGAVPLKGCAWDIRGPALDSSQMHAAEGNENGKWMLVFYLLALIEPRKGCRSHSSCWPICSIADYICSCHYVVKSSFWSCSKNGAYLHIKFVLDCAA